MKLNFLFSIAAFLLYNLSVGQSIFTNPITHTNPSATSPFTTGQVVVANLTASGIARGSGIAANAGADRYNANGWETASLDPNAYFEFTLMPTPTTHKINFISFVYTGQASGTGATTFAFRSSLDSYNTNIGAPVATGTTISLSAAAYQNVTGAITFRLYGWGASAAGGTFSINDFTFNGAVVLATPSPEIDVSGGSSLNQPIADGSLTANTTNGTLFPPTFVGSTSAAKQYRIRNTGTATLNVSNISISGVNPGDFTLTPTTPQTISYPMGLYDITITFSPQAEGNRTAIVTIANNDADENPYTFLIQGTGDCAVATNTITPLSGPVGTEITITATTNNLTGATVTFNGIAAAVTVIDATHIKTIVPPGATTGALLTMNSQGCSGSNPFTVISKVISACEGGASARSQLFISEVTDHGSGAHSYVEIHNATGATVNLLNYTLRVHNNGAASATAPNTVTLPSFNLLNNSSYVIAFGGGDAGNGYGAISADFISTANGINNDDNLRLHNSAGTHIDQWGLTTGAVFTVSANNYYYRRKNTGITAPSTTWNPSDWITGTPVDYSDIGSYDFSTGTPPTVTVHPGFVPTCKSTTLTVAGSEGVALGNGLAYQWYSVAPNATTWTAVANSGVFSGATTTTLTISDLAGLEGYQFYSQVREDSATCYSASNAVMVHEAQTVTWNGSWNPSAPTLTSKVIIAAAYNTVTQGNFEACSVTINPTASLTIGSDDYVLIQTNLAVNGSLVIDDSGSLVMIDDLGTVSSAGNTQVLRTTAPYKKFDYTYWSSPVQSANIGTTFPDWRTDHSYTFNTANFSDLAPLDGFDDNQNDWVLAGPGATMTSGKGYIVMAPTTGTFPTTNTVTFSGTVNNGIITVPLALSGVASNPNDDFNLIGNPYPSAISATDFINENDDISGTLYFWAHVTSVSTSTPGPDYSNYTRDDYALFNLTGGTRASLSVPASTVPTGYVASGQGFFVEADLATNVTFNNAMRSKLHDNSDFFRSATNATVDAQQSDRIWLNLQHSDDLFSQQLIGYFDEATLEYDRGYDGIVSKSGNSISFYSLIDGDYYRIQGRPAFSQNDTVPLGYITTAAGNFTISIDAVEGQLGQEQDVFVEDLQTGIIHNLKQSPYNFTSEVGTFNERFVLRYTSEALNNVDFTGAAQFAVSVNEGIIGVRSATAAISAISLYDMLGRIVYDVKNVSVNTFHFDATRLSTQSYIIKTTLENGEIITRKFVLK